MGEQTKSRKQQGARAEFRAPVVVSDAGAWNTFTRLLPASALPFEDQLKSSPAGFEVVELFLGLRRDPREMGFRGENHWIFSSFDHDEMYADEASTMIQPRTGSFRRCWTLSSVTTRDFETSLSTPSW